LRVLLAAQCQDEPSYRKEYAKLGRRDFFLEVPLSDDPIQNLAEFLAYFTISAGRLNGFLAPYEVVTEFLEGYGISCDYGEFLLDAKRACAACEADEVSLAESLRANARQPH